MSGVPPESPGVPRPSASPRRSREKPFGLPRHRRLRVRRDFVRVERQGQRHQGSFVIACIRPGPGRLGLTVSKKVGEAVVRTRVKRRLREIARSCKPLWRGKDVVLIARPEAAGADPLLLKQEVQALLGRTVAGPASRPQRAETERKPHASPRKDPGT